jgi:hypothetical protein
VAVLEFSPTKRKAASEQKQARQTGILQLLLCLLASLFPNGQNYYSALEIQILSNRIRDKKDFDELNTSMETY